MDILSHYHLDGNDYYKINPHPYITIDITDSYDKNEVWSANKTLNLNFQNKMIIENKLNIVIHNFQIKNLFYYDNYGKLILNDDIVKKLKYSPFVVANKTCVFKYAVIPDEKSKDIEYEGVIFMINTPDNFCYLTFEEVSLLYYMLKSVDMMGLTLQLLNYYNSFKFEFDNEIIDVLPEMIKTEDIEMIDSPIIPQKEEPNTIPDL